MSVTFGTARRGLGGQRPLPGPLAVPNVTAHPSTASVPITVLPYDGPSLCGFNVAIKELRRLRGLISRGRECVSEDCLLKSATVTSPSLSASP